MMGARDKYIKNYHETLLEGIFTAQFFYPRFNIGEFLIYKGVHYEKRYQHSFKYCAFKLFCGAVWRAKCRGRRARAFLYPAAGHCAL